VFHSPGYRSRYAEFLKIDFPRLPLTGNLELFRALARLGGELTGLHLLESPIFAHTDAAGRAGILPAESGILPDSPNARTARLSQKASNDVRSVPQDAEHGGQNARPTPRAHPEYLGPRNPTVEKISWSRDTVWVDKAQTTGFRGVREPVWNFHIGGYQVCQKWLKDRKGRTLTPDDLAHYQKIVVALAETIRLMAEIDEVIEKHGGWPGAFAAKAAHV